MSFIVSCLAVAAVPGCIPQWAPSHKADAGLDAAGEPDSEDGGADEDASEQTRDAGTDDESDGSPLEPTHDSSTNDAASPHDAAPTDDGGCADGYIRREGACHDVDECFEGTHECHMTASCDNTDGGYDCECPLGYSGGTSGGFACASRIAVGDRFACALLSDGRVKCWGRNGEGQLGDGTMLSRPTPVFVKGLDRVVAIAAHDSKSACALRDDGRVVCWGDNASGQLGDGTVAARAEFAAVPKVGDIVALSVRNTLACAIARDGSLLCWGSRGQSGSQGVTTNLTPIRFMGAPPLVSVEVGWNGLGCAISTLGTGWCWSVDPAPRFTEVQGLTNVVRLALGLIGCGLHVSGNVSCWRDPVMGADEVYQLHTVVSLSLGLENAYAVQRDGTIYAWRGAPDSPTGQYAYTTEPIDAVVVAGGGAGSPTACAVVRDGTVRCWGINSEGQLGDGTDVSPEIDMTTKIYKVTTVKDLDLW